jgi:hypothetical protein
MKEFPEESELQFFVGLRVGNIIFQPYSIDVTFDDNTYLVAEGILEHVDQNGVIERLEPKKGFGATTLHRIVDKLVILIVRKPWSLEFRFENGHSLAVISIPGPIESGHISHAGDMFVF